MWIPEVSTSQAEEMIKCRSPGNRVGLWSPGRGEGARSRCLVEEEERGAWVGGCLGGSASEQNEEPMVVWAVGQHDMTYV